MSTYTLKSVVRRGSMLGAVLAIVVATVLPAASAYADALNPLTERSLLLSSSAPGYQNSDGAGNTESNLNANGEFYAPPGSGPNGQKTGETFTFKVSSDSASRPIEAFTFQYCTGAAGNCRAPGNNAGNADPNDDGSGTGSTRQPNDAAQMALKHADLDVNYTGAVPGTDFNIFVDTDADGIAEDSEPAATNWVMSTSNVEDYQHADPLTGKRNFITLTSGTTGTGLTPAPDTQIRIVFKASVSNYITNPGSGSFFVKINTYDTEDTDEHIPTVPAVSNTHIIDGGVTVANVMTDSIHITTKVLETMSFSVGTQNEDTVTLTNPETHGTCDAILQPDNNRLQLGDPDGEYSLQTTKAWDVYSYWRLSSNSSGGATVYYSGNTLANTVGDEIDEIGGTAAESNPGTNQFGLAFVDAGEDDFDDILDGVGTGLFTVDPTNYREPSLYVLDEETPYAAGTGEINNESGAADATFAFKKSSNTIPEVIATDNQDVIRCDTAKMRYVANIGADTPAGVYTTKINYLAAPQY